MSARETIHKQFEAAQVAHDKNRKAYRDAIAERNAADQKVRSTCAAASESANEVAALKSALDKLPAPKLEAVE